MLRRTRLLLSVASPVLAHAAIAARSGSRLARPSSRRALVQGSAAALGLPTVNDLTDPREWLEDVEGDMALDWVRQRNAHALSAIGEPSDKPLYSRLLNILDSSEKIPYIGRVLNGLYYNFWEDENHVRGIWRRCTLDEYRKESPEWEVVLDIDALGAEDGVSWVWAGSTVLDEGPDVRKDRVMISLSRGGADATVAREFCLDKKAFVPESEGGFVLPEAKSDFCFRGRDTLLVGGVFGDAEQTDSGYSRTVRAWRRGTPLETAQLEFEGEQTDVAASGAAYLDRGNSYEMRVRAITFYESRVELRRSDGTFAHVPVPEDAGVETFADQLLVTLRSPWCGHAAGALLAAPVGAFMDAASDEARGALLTPLFTPTETCSLEGSSETKSYLILSVLDNVVSELRFWRYGEGGAWSLERAFKDDGFKVVSASGVNADETDDIWVTSDGFTQPPTLALAEAGSPKVQEPLKSLPAFYDASGVETQQLYATSADGTQVPYFLVAPKGLPLDGSTPTLLYGYGGFEISLTPSYAATVGVGWLEKGGVYAQANIRGGGEFGPKWHQAALKEKRHKAYEDFEAVAKDLIARGVTSAARLGCQGGSNGGLLTGNMLARNSGLFGAIVCQVPLLDMKRFHKLLAGASWMGEYGDPDSADWESFLGGYSPYHLVNEGAAASYPPFLCTTSTRDDRVHPGHARKLVGKLAELGAPAYYYENIEGGHGGAADSKQRAFMSVLEYDFLEQALAGGKLGGGHEGEN